MISIIVPVYNVEPYLRRCLDSIIEQTYRDLEILVIDDGSTDQSGKICDEYAELDERIRVTHTENRGLSCARNRGLDNATGDWIGFVDSDDWIEPDMYEVLLKRAEETGADIVECGYYKEFKNTSEEMPSVTEIISETDAIEALVYGKITGLVWNKVYKRDIFSTVRFPVGREFEDIYTTHKLVCDARVAKIKESYYHYVQRNSGISQCHEINNLTDNWVAHKKRYEDLEDRVSEGAKRELLKYCAYAIARTWMWNSQNTDSSECTTEMAAFAREKYPIFGCPEWPVRLRISICLARSESRMSFQIAHLLYRIYRTTKPEYYE